MFIVLHHKNVTLQKTKVYSALQLFYIFTRHLVKWLSIATRTHSFPLYFTCFQEQIRCHRSKDDSNNEYCFLQFKSVADMCVWCKKSALEPLLDLTLSHRMCECEPENPCEWSTTKENFQISQLYYADRPDPYAPESSYSKKSPSKNVQKPEWTRTWVMSSSHTLRKGTFHIPSHHWWQHNRSRVKHWFPHHKSHLTAT